MHLIKIYETIRYYRLYCILATCIPSLIGKCGKEEVCKERRYLERRYAKVREKEGRRYYGKEGM